MEGPCRLELVWRDSLAKGDFSADWPYFGVLTTGLLQCPRTYVFVLHIQYLGLALGAPSAAFRSPDAPIERRTAPVEAVVECELDVVSASSR